MAITTTTSDEKEDDVGNSFTTAPPVRTAPLPGALMDEDVGPVYARKARALNAAIQDIGMGKYQWALFCVAGFGWCADNV